MRIRSSVGRGGRNDRADVEAVQARLRELGYAWVEPDGVVGDDTLSAIRLFQAIKNGHQQIEGHPENDGLVEPGGDTALWLAAQNAPRWGLLPAGSPDEGFVSWERQDEADEHDYGTSWLAAALRAAGAAYRDGHLRAHPGAAPLTINDASLPRGGPTRAHKGHQTGLSCDLRLPRGDGAAGFVTWRDALYDRAACRAACEALCGAPSARRLFFNDPEIAGARLCVEVAGHDDHLHFEIAPPPRQD